MGKLPFSLGIFGLFVITLPLDVFSEGSCSWEEARTVLEQAPDLLTFAEESLQIDPTGFALRLGDHYSDLSGLRVAPFTFRAVSKSSPSLLLEIIVEAELTFYDASGKTLSSEDAHLAHQVRQTFTGLRFRPSSVSSSIDPLTAGDSQRTAWILEQHAALSSAILDALQFPFPPECAPLSGEVRLLRQPASQSLRAIQVHGSTSGDRPLGFREDYTFAGEDLLLFRRQETSQIVHPEDPDQTIFRRVETTYYFEEGTIYFASERRAQAGAASLLETALSTASPRRIPLSGTESMLILSRASRLALVQSSPDLLPLFQPEP